MTPRHVALLGTLAAIWGSSYLLIKYALRGFSPAEIVCVRAAGAALVLWPLCRLRGGATRAGLSDIRLRPFVALGLGAIAVAAPFLLISFGEREVPSGLTAILISPSPIFVALIAPLVDTSERIRGQQWIGLVAGLGGVALLVGVESVSTLAQFLGAVAILGASACYAAGSFVVKGAYRGTPPLVTSTFAVSGAAVLTLPFAAATAEHGAPGAGPIAALIALAIVHTGLAFIIFYTLISQVGAGRANLVSYLAPPFALAYGAIFLSEDISAASIGGLVLILGGVALASRRRAAPAPEGACTEDLLVQEAVDGRALGRVVDRQP